MTGRRPEEDPRTTSPSNRLDVRAPAFRPVVHFSTVGGTTHAETAATGGTTATLSKDSTREPETAPAPNRTTVALPQAVVNTPMTGPPPTSMGTDPPTSTTDSVAQGATLPVTSRVSQGATTTLTPTTGMNVAPAGITGMPLAYMHPNLPQIPNFHGGDQRDGETFEDWWGHFEAVARIAGWDQNFSGTQRKCQVLLQIMCGSSKDQLCAVGDCLEEEVYAGEAHSVADTDVP